MSRWIRRVLAERLSEIRVTTPRTPPRWWDWLLAVALLAAVVAEVVADPPPWPVVELIAAGVAISVIPFRRMFPVAAAVIGFGAQFGAETAARLTHHGAETTIGHYLTGLILIYSLCRYPGPKRVVLGMSAAMAMVVSGELIMGTPARSVPQSLIPWSILAALAVAMRYRDNLRQQRISEVRLAERHALARDLHDTVAHHVSAIAVQAQAARFVAQTDPERALDAVAAIEVAANTAIDDMRRVVGILRSDHDGLDDSVELADLTDEQGSPRVDVRLGGELPALPSAVRAGLYRIAQEAITNARRHARDPTRISVTVAPWGDSVILEVADDGLPPPAPSYAGYGLTGMNERALALGGALDAGPAPGGGWLVRAVIPRGRPR